MEMVDDCDSFEKTIIEIFKKDFIQRVDIGTEYFEGNYRKMKRIMKNYQDELEMADEGGDKIFIEFLNECTIKTNPLEKNHIHFTTLYDRFKSWFQDKYPDAKIPSNKQLVKTIKMNTKIKVERFYFNEKQRFGIRNLKLKID